MMMTVIMIVIMPVMRYHAMPSSSRLTCQPGAGCDRVAACPPPDWIIKEKANQGTLGLASSAFAGS